MSAERAPGTRVGSSCCCPLCLGEDEANESRPCLSREAGPVEEVQVSLGPGRRRPLGARWKQRRQGRACAGERQQWPVPVACASVWLHWVSGSRH